MSDSTPDETRRTGESAWRRWSTVEPILDRALELPLTERTAFVLAETGDDVDLRAAVEELLRRTTDDDARLEGSAPEAFPELLATFALSPTSIGERIGAYRIVGEAGRGGMGTVYVAERADDQYRSKVALKLLRHGLDDPVFVRRFLEERQILASLAHPRIARLYDGGVTESGRPWFAMEYVEGTPIDEYCESKRLTMEQRLRLFLHVCDAVSYAHRSLVIHRDLKPSNIFVDATGEVRLLDFGIAKVFARRDMERGTETTITSLPVLTPEYASPEQLRGERVTTASDVYSLGVVLYKLLTGARPYSFRARTTRDFEKAVLEEEPARPSVMAQRVTASTSGAGAARVVTARQLRGDLDAIVLKAIQKPPDRRYVSVDEMATDLSRYLAGLTVAASPDSWRYRSARFITRHPLGLLFTIVLVLVLAGSAILNRVQLERVERERAIAERVSSFLVDLFRSSNVLLPGGGDAVAARTALDSAAARLQSDLASEPETRARLLRVIADSYQSLELYDAARVAIDSTIAIRRRIGGDQLALVRDLEFSIELLRRQGRIQAAHASARDLLTLRRRIHPPRSIELVKGLFYTGCRLVDDGPRRESEGYLREGITILRSHRDAPAFTLARGLECLGRLILETELQRDSRYLVEAEQVLREALHLAQLSERADSPVLATYHVDLARVLSRRGSDSGLIMIRRAIALHESTPEHRSVVFWDRAVLAELLADRGRLMEADSVYRHLIPEQRTGAIARTLDFGLSLKGYGRVLLECGDAVGAESILRESVAILDPAVSPRSRMVVDARVLLGSALARLRRYAEADSLLSANLPFAVALWGESDPRTLIARQASRDVRERPASSIASDTPRCALVP